MLKKIKRVLMRWGLMTCTHGMVCREYCGNGWAVECDICGERIAWHLHQKGSNGDGLSVCFIEVSGKGGLCKYCKEGEDLPRAVTEADYRNILNLKIV